MLLTALLLLQSATADLRGEALVGRVRDAQGAPVMGATIQITVTANRNYPHEGSFVQAGLHLLRWTALPRGSTDARGEFRIPLHDDHRRLGVAGGMRLAIAVVKAGFRTWLGPCGTCPGRMGPVEIRLEPDLGETVRGRFVAPPDHQGSLAGRVGVTWNYHNTSTELDARSFGSGVDTAADGTFVVPRHGLDGPQLPVPSLGQNIKTLGFHLRPVVVGMEPDIHWFPQDAAELVVRLAPRQAATRSLPVRAEGERPPATVRVFYRPASGAAWILEQPFGPLLSRGTSEPYGVAAAGMMGTWMAGAAGEARLRPLPAGPVELQVRSTRGEPVPDAEVEVIALGPDFWATADERLPLCTAPARHNFLRAKTSPAGTVTIPLAHCADAHALVVRAAGHVPLAMDLGQAVATGRIALEPAQVGVLRLMVRGPDGRPCPRASVLVSDSAYGGGAAALAGPPPRTDGAGVCEVRLAPGAHQVLVFQDGCAFGHAEFQLGERLTLELQLGAAAAGVVEVTTEAGAPVPWLLVRGTHSSAITDARGRARLDGQSSTAPVPLRFCDNGLGLDDRPAALEPNRDVTPVRCTAEPPAQLRLRTPPGLGAVALQLSTPRQNLSTAPTAFAASDFLILLADRGPVRAEVKVGSLSIQKEVPLVAGKVAELDLRPEAWPEARIELVLAGAGFPPGCPCVALEVAGAPRLDRVDLAARWRQPGDPANLLRLRAPKAGRVAYDLLHPRLLPQRISFVDGKPEGEGARAQVALGAPLTLRVSWPEGVRPESIAFTATLLEGTEARAVQGFRGLTPATPGTTSCDLAWNSALPPGEGFAVQIDMANPGRTRHQLKEFEVRGTGPITVPFAIGNPR